MKYLRTYEDLSSDETSEIRDIISDITASLVDIGLKINLQIQTDVWSLTPKIIVYIIAKSYKLNDVIYEVDHLVSKFYSIGHPLISSRYRLYNNYGTPNWVDIFDNEIEHTQQDSIFDSKDLDLDTDIEALELIFER